METTFKCKYSISVLFLAHNTLNPSPPNTLMCAAQDLLCMCVSVCGVFLITYLF